MFTTLTSFLVTAESRLVWACLIASFPSFRCFGRGGTCGTIPCFVVVVPSVLLVVVAESLASTPDFLLFSSNIFSGKCIEPTCGILVGPAELRLAFMAVTEALPSTEPRLELSDKSVEPSAVIVEHMGS